MIVFVFISYNTSSENKQSEICEKLVFEMKLYDRKISNKHQVSPKWMLILKNDLANRWAENKC